MEEALQDSIVCRLKSKSIKKAANHCKFATQVTALGMEKVAQQAAEINTQLMSAVKEVRVTECRRCGDVQVQEEKLWESLKAKYPVFNGTLGEVT